jgi:hypothetical protein
MRIGLAVHFFDFRNDVRQLLTELSKTDTVVLLVREQDKAQVAAFAPHSTELRIISERPTSRPKRAWNALWERLYLLVGRLPKSKRNFQLMELFKISLHPSKAAQLKARRRLAFRIAMPPALSYDAFLAGLYITEQTNLSDLDAILCFTDIADNLLMARLVRHQATLPPLYVYVYSWDHPCKHMRYSASVRYLAWNQGLKQDIAELQRIPDISITAIGASQFGYIDRYLAPALVRAEISPLYPFPYIYFGCAIGLPGLHEQEVAVCHRLAATLKTIHPSWKLVVRPYPVLKDWSAYAALAQIDNVVLEGDYRQTGTLAVGEEAIETKFATIAGAMAFLHMGTTLGLEACFTETPSRMVDFTEFAHDKHKAGLYLYHFIHQYQNDKYLLFEGGPGSISSDEDFASLLIHLSKPNGKAELGKANEMVRSQFPVRSFTELAQNIVAHLAEGKSRI